MCFSSEVKNTAMAEDVAQTLTVQENFRIEDAEPECDGAEFLDRETVEQNLGVEPVEPGCDADFPDRETVVENFGIEAAEPGCDGADFPDRETVEENLRIEAAEAGCDGPTIPERETVEENLRIEGAEPGCDGADFSDREASRKIEAAEPGCDGADFPDREASRKIEAAEPECDGADFPDREASSFELSCARKSEFGEVTAVETARTPFKENAESTVLVKSEQRWEEIDKQMNGSLPVVKICSKRPKPIAKRNWPPGCGPFKLKRTGDGVFSKLKQESFTIHLNKKQKLENGNGSLQHMDVGMDDVKVKKNVNFDDAASSTDEDEQNLKGYVGMGVLSLENGEETLDEAVYIEDLDAKVKDEINTHACRPVAKKKMRKMIPSSSNGLVQTAEVSRLSTNHTKIAEFSRSTMYQGVVKANLASEESKGDRWSNKKPTEDDIYKDNSVQDLKVEEERTPNKNKRKEKLTGNSFDNNLKTKKRIEVDKKASDKKKLQGSPKPMPKTPAKKLITSLPDKDGTSEGGGRDISRFTDDPHNPEARESVRQALRMFDAIRRKLQRDEEGGDNEVGIKRPDLKAFSLMNARNLSINRVKKFGYVPGVEVGDHFYFRVELCIVGIHRQIQGGIDSVSAKENEWGRPIAASITASGGYEDDLDDGESMVYTGQGGNHYKGNKRQQEDQKLERGNLAMENSYKLGLPVRVIRGCKDKSSPSGTIYTYDGLYLVVESWLDRGVSGFGVYRFRLQRIPGQPPLGSLLVKFVGSLKSKPSKREGLIIADISNGQEKIPVCVVNEIDESSPIAHNFHYIVRVSIPPSFVKPPLARGCGCKKSCSSASVCECIQKNGGKAPYTGGLLVEAKNVVYECGIQCGCPPTCQNRVTQNGIRHQLEIFKTNSKGWAVRSWDSIPSGSFICEYIGELVDSQEAERLVENDEYLFDLDLIKGNQARGVDVSMFFKEAAKENNEEVEEANLSIDASKKGNVGRFINHSCSPNLFAQCVLFHHDDLRIPHIMLFSMENIPPLTELTYDYGYTIGQVIDSKGNVKVKDCHCGEIDCKGRMY